MKIYEALADLNVPVCHVPYKGDAGTYITYQLLGQNGQIYAEGTEGATAVIYMVDVFEEVFSGTLVESVKEALEQAGYIAIIEMEDYDERTDSNHVSIYAEIEGAQYG